MNSAGKQEVVRLQPSIFDPRLQGISGGCRDFELDWPLGLVLHDDGAGRHLVAMAHISDTKSHPRSLLSIPRLRSASSRMRPSIWMAGTQCPDVLGLERCLLADDLALVPRLTMSGVSYCFHDGLPSS